MVLSGDREALDELLGSARSRRHPRPRGSRRRLRLPLGPGRGCCASELLEALAPISPRAGQIPFYSTVTGGPLDTPSSTPEYWYRNLRETVRFEPVPRATACPRLPSALLEISPHPVLAFALDETLDEVPERFRRGNGARHPAPRRGWPGALRSLARRGPRRRRGVRLAALLRRDGRPGASTLPTYPFQRQRYWLSGRRSGVGDPASIGLAPAGHPLLGAAIEDPPRRAASSSPAASPSPPTLGWRTTPSPAPSCSPAPPSWSWR